MPADEMPFEAIVARLEAIVVALEGPDGKLEDALALFEEGMGLTKRGGEQLAAAERRLEVLLADGQAAPLPSDAMGAQDGCTSPQI